MQLACPNCGTRDVKVSHPQGLVQYIKNFFGISPLRCRRCSNRWETSVWADGSWKYARCPRCYRQELTKWTMQYYNPPRWTRFLLRVGASPRRCPACRCNFATFKPARGNFEWRHQVRGDAVPRTQNPGTPEDGAEVAAGQTPPGEGSGEQMP
jgi:hypothetical protein